MNELRDKVTDYLHPLMFYNGDQEKSLANTDVLSDKVIQLVKEACKEKVDVLRKDAEAEGWFSIDPDALLKAIEEL